MHEFACLPLWSAREHRVARLPRPVPSFPAWCRLARCCRGPQIAGGSAEKVRMVDFVSTGLRSAYAVFVAGLGRGGAGWGLTVDFLARPTGIEPVFPP